MPRDGRKPVSAIPLVKKAPGWRAGDAEELGHITYVSLEPVYGCANQCPQCCMGDLPAEPRFSRVSAIEKHLRKLRSAGAAPESFTYTLGGEPLAHPRLEKITAAVKKVFPKSEVFSFWGFSGASSYGELLKRTQGLDELEVSLDSHHYAGVRKGMKNAGLLTREALAKAGFATEQEAVFGEMMKRIGWALKAGRENGFGIRARVTYSNKNEEDAMKRVIASALERYGEPGCELEEPEIAITTFRRHPRGDSAASKDLDYGTLRLSHDGRASFIRKEAGWPWEPSER